MCLVLACARGALGREAAGVEEDGWTLRGGFADSRRGVVRVRQPEWNATVQAGRAGSIYDRLGWLMHHKATGRVVDLAASPSMVYALYRNGSLVAVNLDSAVTDTTVVPVPSGSTSLSISRGALWITSLPRVTSVLLTSSGDRFVEGGQRDVRLPNGVDARLFASDLASNAVAAVGSDELVYYTNAPPEQMTPASWRIVAFNTTDVSVAGIHAMEVHVRGGAAGFVLLTLQGEVIVATVDLALTRSLPPGDGLPVDEIAVWRSNRDELVFPATRRWVVTSGRTDYFTIVARQSRTEDAVIVVEIENMWVSFKRVEIRRRRTVVTPRQINIWSTTGMMYTSKDANDADAAEWHVYVFLDSNLWVTRLKAPLELWKIEWYNIAIAFVFGAALMSCIMLRDRCFSSNDDDSTSGGDNTDARGAHGRRDSMVIISGLAAIDRAREDDPLPVFVNPYFVNGGDECIKDPPVDVVCPITLAIMYSPVMCINKHHTFERFALERTLRLKQECPICRASMTLADVRPDYVADRRVVAFLLQHLREHPEAPIEIPAAKLALLGAASHPAGDADDAVDDNDAAVAVDTPQEQAVDTSGVAEGDIDVAVTSDANPPPPPQVPPPQQ